MPVVHALRRAWDISPSELEIHHEIGVGAIGRVLFAQWSDLPVVVKVLRAVGRELDETATQEFRREVEFLQTIRHPNIVLFYGAGTFDSGVCGVWWGWGGGGGSMYVRVFCMLLFCMYSITVCCIQYCLIASLI